MFDNKPPFNLEAVARFPDSTRFMLVRALVAILHKMTYSSVVTADCLIIIDLVLCFPTRPLLPVHNPNWRRYKFYHTVETIIKTWQPGDRNYLEEEINALKLLINYE